MDNHPPPRKSKSPKSAAERQKASRAKRKLQTFDGYSPLLLSILLSAEATRALHVLSTVFKNSQKATIEHVLIEAHKKLTEPDNPTGD